jgi:hypothetical protein
VAFNERRAVMARYVAEPVSITSLRVLIVIHKIMDQQRQNGWRKIRPYEVL